MELLIAFKQNLLVQLVKPSGRKKNWYNHEILSPTNLEMSIDLSQVSSFDVTESIDESTDEINLVVIADV